MEEVPDNKTKLLLSIFLFFNWTMATEGSKRVKWIGQDDEWQFTATFAKNI